MKNDPRRQSDDQHREAHADGQTRWYCQVPRPRRKAADPHVRPQIDARAIHDAIDSETHRAVRRSGPGQDRRSARSQTSGCGERSTSSRRPVPGISPRSRCTSCHGGARRPLDRIEHGAVQSWLADLLAAGQSAASVRKSYGVLSGSSTLPCGIGGSRRTRRRALRCLASSSSGARYLTAAQVTQLAGGRGRAAEPLRLRRRLCAVPARGLRAGVLRSALVGARSVAGRVG